MRRKLVAANWKMHGRLAEVFTLLEPWVSKPLSGIDVLICPPAPYLLPAASILQNTSVLLGAQNLAVEADGAFTGEVSGEMLLDCGASHVLVGHSERRQLYGETNRCVAQKFVRAQQAGLIPVLCVGETKEERETDQTEAIIAAQLEVVLEVAGIAGFQQAILAYEPVWAIGTGLTATPQQAQAVHVFMREWLARHDESSASLIPILYGGSVKADNAASLFAEPDIDGGLVGGASLDIVSFQAICQAAI